MDRVRINTDSLEDIMTIPGIGEKVAGFILAERQVRPITREAFKLIPHCKVKTRHLKLIDFSGSSVPNFPNVDPEDHDESQLTEGDKELVSN